MEIYIKSIKYSNDMIKARLRGKRLLDIGGAEYCHRINFFSKFVDEAVLVDLQEPFQPLENNIVNFVMPAENISPETVGFFDEIILSNVLEHVDTPLTVLKKTVSVLNGKGGIHILSPNCESLNRRIGVKMNLMKDIKEIPEKEKPMGHKHAFSVKDIFSLAGQAGLVIDECIGVFLKPIPTNEMIKWPEERIQAFFAIAPELPPSLCHEVYFHCSLS